MRAFVFPGQGSQFIGMGKDLAEAFPEARAVFDEIDDALGQNLFRLMTAGEESDLNLTENTQPALMAVSCAVIGVIRNAGKVRLEDKIQFAAGHSLGEYSALTAVDAFDLTQTARLLKLRGQSMQRAVPVGKGAMAAILGFDLPEVETLVRDAAIPGEVCECANDNSPGQVVISGTVAGVDAAIMLAQERGAKRALKLPVSAPFHSSLMAPAAQAMAAALIDSTIRTPALPIISNVTASAVSEPHDIRRLLVDQITGMVRWRESVTYMKEQGVTEMVEIGAGKVLSGLIKRIEKDVACESAGTPEQVEALMKKLQG